MYLGLLLGGATSLLYFVYAKMLWARLIKPNRWTFILNLLFSIIVLFGVIEIIKFSFDTETVAGKSSFNDAVAAFAFCYALTGGIFVFKIFRARKPKG
jgi:glycosyltransferase involved in cell wall biosynthesis